MIISLAQGFINARRITNMCQKSPQSLKEKSLGLVLNALELESCQIWWDNMPNERHCSKVVYILEACVTSLNGKSLFGGTTDSAAVYTIDILYRPDGGYCRIVLCEPSPTCQLAKPCCCPSHVNPAHIQLPNPFKEKHFFFYCYWFVFP